MSQVVILNLEVDAGRITGFRADQMPLRDSKVLCDLGLSLLRKNANIFSNSKLRGQGVIIWLFINLYVASFLSRNPQTHFQACITEYQV